MEIVQIIVNMDILMIQIIIKYAIVLIENVKNAHMKVIIIIYAFPVILKIIISQLLMKLIIIVLLLIALMKQLKVFF